MDVRNICLCCVRCPADRDMKMPYIHCGKTEIYSDMLKECFEIQLTKLLSEDELRICEVCAGRLRDAYNFKQQVLQSQAELLTILDKGQNTLNEEHVQKEEESSLKSELSDIDEELVQEESSLKSELSDIDEELVLPDYSEEVKLEVPDPPPSDDETSLKEFETTDYSEEVKSEIPDLPPSDAETSLKEFETTDMGNLPADVCKLETTTEVTTENFYPKPKTGRNIQKCRTCGEQFANNDLLVKHKQIHKTCTKCNKQFKYESKLKYHLLICCNRNVHVCDLCKKQFLLQSDLLRHKMAHFGAKPFSCGECDKRFTDVSDLNIHKNTHEQTTYTCDICQVKFRKKHVLIAHIGKHQGKKHFGCNLCSKRFWDNFSLYLHTECHTRTDKKYTCDECEKTFRFKADLASHLRYHTKLFSCNVCAMKFSTRRCLRRHEGIHTDRRPYPCESCHKSFRHKHHLEMHRVIHTGEKPYCCETCGKSFSQERNLKTHLKTHVKGHFPCDLCAKSYATKESLRQHSRTHREKGKAELKKRKVKKGKTKKSDDARNY